MVASANSDLYTPFPQGPMREESGPSSEEGSGLHSPIFGVQYAQPHGDSNLRYHPEQVDIQNAAGILASQFDYNGLSNMNVQQGPLLDATLDPSNGHHHHRASYPHDFPLSSRNQLGLDIPTQTLSNTRLPPPPSQGGQVYFTSSPDRHYADDHSHGTTYSSGGMPMDGGHQTSSSSAPANQSNTAGNSANTSQEPRKESSGTVIACRQCRARKIRCDSTRPVCNNCVRRSNECQYDAAPKRRGPDKRPGTRQRSCKKRPADGSAPPPPSKRKRSATGQPGDSNGTPGAGVKENMASMKSTFSSAARPSGLVEDTRGQGHMLGRLSPPSLDLKPLRGMEGQGMFAASVSPTTRRGPISPYDHETSYKSFRPLDVNIRQAELHASQGKSPSLPGTPSLEFPRKMWWEELLATYSSSRDESLKDITSDLTSLFNSTGYWLSFINVNYFLRTLYNPDERSRMQPSIIYAGLALATLVKSSQLELGVAGRNRALWLRDAAQSNLEQSLNSQWIDLSLAEAAYMLALFESSAHPTYSPARAASAISFLDTIIRRLQLTTLDANDPDVTSFKPHQVPSVKTTMPKDPSQKCTCIPLPPNSNLPPDHFSSSWSYTPPWDPNWSATDIYNEECRRLCWSALTLVAGHTAQSAAFDKEPTQYYLTDPANFALLFPGEAGDRLTGNHRAKQSAKDSVWALYCRSMLLWNFSHRLGHDNITDSIKADYAFEVWVESQSIQDALDAHICNLDTALLYMCREHLYNTRMTVTRTLRSLQGSDSGIPHQPVFSRKEAEEWLYYQDQVIKRVKASINHLGEAQGHLLTRRPFQVSWFASQLAICLSLWNNDRSLTSALELGKSVLVLLDILNALWPSPVPQGRSDELRKRLGEACNSSNLPSPMHPDYSLPSVLKGQ